MFSAIHGYMRYGHFDDAEKEYVIETPQSPLPWINYLGSEDFFALISNTAGGYAFYKDARLRRITRYRYNNSPLDQEGFRLYIKDGESVWNPSWQPMKTPLDSFQCRHGLGYSVFTGSKNDLEVSQTMFVPRSDDCLIYKITLKNNSGNRKSITLFSFIEFCLWDAADDSSNFQRNLSTGEVEVEGSAIYHKTEYRERKNHCSVFWCSLPISGFDTDMDSFNGPYGSARNPDAVLNGACSDSIAHGWRTCGSHQLDIALEPAGERAVIFGLGYIENPDDKKWAGPSIIDKSKAQDMMSRYKSAADVEKAFSALKRFWAELLERFQIRSADSKLDRMVNIWNQYQCMVTFNMSRSASYFESGMGRGMGFRDSCQDILGFVHMIPALARRRILDMAATQLPDGSAYHQYQPLTKRGNTAVGSGFTAGHLGPHGLPLIGRADWNDCLNLNCFSSAPGQSFQTTGPSEGPVAESVFIAGMFVKYGKAYACIASRMGLPKEAEEAIARVNEMEKTILTWGWDGEWFLRAYDAFGNPIGSHACREGKIFIEPQGMCVMAGIGKNSGEAEKAMKSVHEILETRYGVVLLNPAYSNYHLELGEISSYPPGVKENGGIFCHNNPWITCAETELGHAEEAWSLYKKICPAYLEDISDIHRTEPYVYSQMIAGKDSPRFGEAKNSWLTGTAAWIFVSISQPILGIKPDYDGLRIEPCLPAELPGYHAVRIFRNTMHDITVKRAGRKRLIADGKELHYGVALKSEAAEVKVMVETE